MRKLLVVAVASAMAGAANVANSAVSEADFAQLKADFAAMSQRLNALEQENLQLRELSETTVAGLELAQTEISRTKQASSASGWTDRIKMKGDFRYRYESIDVEDVDTRERNRIRARVSITTTLPNNTEVAFGVTTGGDNPVSGNQTLGGGGTAKDLSLDIAYAKWNITESVSLTGGKFYNPLFRPQKTGLLWDSDWRPEGLSLGWNSEHLFATFLGNYIESDSKTGNEAFAWGVQGGTKLSLGESASLTAAISYYDFPVKGNEAYFDGKFFGNSSIDGLYEFNYEMFELGADVGLSLFDMPFNVYGNYVQNQDPDDFDTGYLVGAKIGKAKAKGTWQVGYQYEDLEADAALGLLTDSNVGGGGTDVKGHRLFGSYAVNNQWILGFTWFVDNEAGEKSLAELGGPVNYDRIILDAKYNY